MTLDRWLLDAGVAGGIATWKGTQIADGGLPPIGLTFALVQLLVALAVFVVLVGYAARS